MVSLDSAQMKEIENKITEITDTASLAKYHLLSRNDLDAALDTLGNIHEIIENINTLIDNY